MPLATQIRVNVNATLSGVSGLSTVSAPIDRNDLVSLATGTGANQADKIYTESRTLAASASVELDLAGVLLDALGGVITLARVKAIIVIAAAANVNTVVMGAAGTGTVFQGPLGSATDTTNIRPGGMAVFVAPDATGWVVVPATADKLKFANSGAGSTVTFDLIIIGASA